VMLFHLLSGFQHFGLTRPLDPGGEGDTFLQSAGNHSHSDVASCCRKLESSVTVL
jgi:hypothetical protein